MLQKLKAARPSIEHNILIGLFWIAVGFWLCGIFSAHQEAKTQAAVRDALKSAPVAQAIEPVSKP